MKKRAPRKLAPRPAARKKNVATLSAAELAALRAELEKLSTKAAVPRWNADPEDVQRAVAKLVLTLAEFVRQLLERQAIRRMDEKTLTPKETEAIGLALMRLEETLVELARRFGVDPKELNLDLGPIGRLM